MPSKRKDETIPHYEDDKTKALRRLAPVDFFVDDNAAHVVSARKEGINALFFPRPWNPSGMTIAETLARLQPC